jgi:hypothetical protein
MSTRYKIFIVAVTSVAYVGASAQFGAGGGPSREAELLVQLPWIIVGATLSIAWLGPKKLRPLFRRASKHAFLVYLTVELVLLLCMFALRWISGPETVSLLTAGALFLTGLLFSGPLIAVFVTASLAVLSMQALWRRSRSRSNPVALPSSDKDDA